MIAVTIYGLFDPRNGYCYYVGQTRTSLYDRLRNHLVWRPRGRRGDWLDALHSIAEHPRIEPLEFVSDTLADEAEYFWITYLSWLGMPLMNHANYRPHPKSFTTKTDRSKRDVPNIQILTKGGRTCTICVHEQRVVIDDQLRQGCSDRRVAKSFEVSDDAIFRHRKHGHYLQSTAEGSRPLTPPGAVPDAPVALRPDGRMRIGSPERPTEPSAAPYRRPSPRNSSLGYQDRATVPSMSSDSHVIMVPEYEVSVQPQRPMDVLRQGLPYIREAIRLAGDDRLEQERLIATLNEALMSESMGL